MTRSTNNTSYIDEFGATINGDAIVAYIKILKRNWLREKSHKYGGKKCPVT